MLDSMFRGVFDTELTNVISPADFLLCVGASLLIGLLLCAMTMWRTKSSGSFVVTLPSTAASSPSCPAATVSTPMGA